MTSNLIDAIKAWMDAVYWTLDSTDVDRAEIKRVRSLELDVISELNSLRAKENEA